MEEIRAFPHGAVAVAAGIESTGSLPAQTVLTLVEQHVAAAVLSTVHRDGIIGSVFQPDFGVPEVPGAGAFGETVPGDNRVTLIFFIVHAVTDGHALGLKLPLRAYFHAGVQQQMPPVGHLHRAAGEAAVLVILSIRGQGGRQELPADKIGGFCVAPVHGAPLGVVGIVLKKQVVFALVGGKAVGVVDPAHAAGEVENRQLRGNNRAAEGLIVSGFL